MNQNTLTSQISLAIKNQKQGKITRAKNILQEVIKQESVSGEVWQLLSNIYLKENNLSEAIDCYEKLIEREPSNYIALSNLGVLYINLGNKEKAVSCWERAIKINPDYSAPYNNLGEFYREEHNYSTAKKYLLQAIELKQDDPLAHYNLGLVYSNQDKLSQAIEHYQKAIDLNPNYCEANNNLANVYGKKAEMVKAITYYKKAIAIKPNSFDSISNLLFSLHYSSNYLPEEIFENHVQYARHYRSQITIKKNSYKNLLIKENKKLRIGYISGDLKIHSVAYFFQPLLEHRDRENFEVICYANNKDKDLVTKKIKQLSDGWRDINNLQDMEVVKLIKEDKIDILVDLSGHTHGNRLSIFAQKPAPIQVTYLGYPNTTGFKTIDYRITDKLADPPGTTEHLYTEKLIHLPHSFLCYHSFIEPPITKEIPVIKNKYITFGSFNNFSKISSPLIEYWSEILHRVPNSKLLLKSKVFKDEDSKNSLYQLFLDRGINKERLQLIDWIKESINHLTLYNEIDIALDTFPYHGTTTTCEALFMGVPVITKEGKTHVSRVGVSLLSSINLSELIASSKDEYINKAVTLSQDIPRLKQLHHSLRNIMKQSPLMDGKLITSNLESAYKNIWTKWCQEQKSLSVSPSKKLTIKPRKKLSLKSNTSDRNITLKENNYQNSSNTKFTILTLHHLSATGGTLISKCLSAMPNVVLLSEVHPCVTSNRFNPFDPIQQFTKYNLLTPIEFQNIFLERIALIVKKCQEHKKHLIIRDHTHSDFLLKRFPAKRNLLSILQNKYSLKSIVTFRNPIDSWLAMLPKNWHQHVKTFDNYCDRYLKLVDIYRDSPYYLYEDFVREPDIILQKMCQYYGIDFDPNYKDKFFKIQLSGDSGRRSPEIAPRPRRKYDSTFVEEVKQSLNFNKICQRLNYSGLE